MSLRPDSVYRVDLRNSTRPKGDSNDDADSPPKVVQIRLTEQALQQLANAYSSSKNGRPSISIDIHPADPLLVIGESKFPLHAPLPASGLQPSKTSSTSDSASTSTAPHELYKLSEDEATLQRIGTIATKLYVKPTRDVSAVAQRLKQQREEEEHRKEERRRALMQGTSPLLPASSSSRTGINKALAGVRASSGSPLLAASPLSRSSSLNRLSTLREPNASHSTSLARGISRDPSPGAAPSATATAHVRPQGASYDANTSARRNERAFTDSPKVSAVTSSRSSNHLPDSERSAEVSTSSRTHRPSAAGDDDGRQHGNDIRDGATTQHSSPISGASDAAPKKTTKLTTRQRLAKATKAGSRLLTASDRRATPERRSAPIATHASPPSKLGASATHTPAGSSVANTASAAPHHSPPKDRVKETLAPTSSRTAPSKPTDGSDREAVHGSSATLRERKISPTPTPANKIARDGSLASSTKSSAAAPQERVRKPDQPGDSSKSSASAPSTTPVEKRAAVPSKETRNALAAGDRVSKASDSKDTSNRREGKPISKEAPPAAVQVVTMKKARQSDPPAVRQASTSTRSTKVDFQSCRSDRPIWDEPPRKREHSSNGHDIKSVPTSSAQTAAKQPNTRKSEDEPADATQRKRRRTNDFASSDSVPSRREDAHRPSSGPSTPHIDESFSRRRESSRDGSSRQLETKSPRDAQQRASIPVSASMPSFASSSNRLQTVAEVKERDSRRPKAETYHDRRRDRSYDEPLYEEYPSQDRGRSSHRDRDEGRRSRQEADDVRAPSHGRPSSSSSVKASPGSVERPTRGVGPGATHWSEPWLDVRSKADWHRLAQRFTKTQEEYLAFRQRLQAESERLDRELELASKEEQASPHLHASNGDGMAERSLLFSPHKASVGGAPSGSSSFSSRSRHSHHADSQISDVEMETAINTSINSRTRSSARAKPIEDGDESPEEGEMRSSDDEEEGLVDNDPPAAAEAGKHTHETASSLDSLLLASRRSESPDNLAWRSSSTKSHSSPNPGADGADRPLSYADLAERVKQLNELHGSLGRMHRVLTEFKAKGAVASAR